MMKPETLLATRSKGLIAMKSELGTQVTLRGTRDGVLIVLGDGEWDALMADLEHQLSRPNASAFFRGAKVRVETGNRFLTQQEHLQLQTVLAAHNIQVGATMPSVSMPTRAPLESNDIYTRSNGATEALIIRRTLRSGQVIQHDGPVVIYGDVNDGAQIVAAGDVLIFGKLRGLVHAGASGDDHATIGALNINAPQLRIGSHIARSPEERKRKPRGPEIATVRSGQIVIEPWRV